MDSPLWDQTTFIGLIKIALIPNSDPFCSMVRTFPSLCLDVKPSERPQLHCHSDASQTAGRIIKTITEPTFNHLQAKNFHLSRLTIIGRVASLKARPGSRWWVRWLYIGDCSGLIGFLKLLIYKVYEPGLLDAFSPLYSSQICLSPGLRRIAKCLWKNVFPGGQD